LRLLVVFVAQSHIKMGVKVREIQRLDINQTELVIGEIMHVLTEQDFSLADGYVDIEMHNLIEIKLNYMT